MKEVLALAGMIIMTLFIALMAHLGGIQPPQN